MDMVTLGSTGITVSYTHLDVYKRQAQHRLTGGQLLAAIHLLFNAQNAVGSLHSS